jgi:hypothetical protein
MRKGNTFSLKLNERHEGTKMTDYDALQTLSLSTMVLSTTGLVILWEDQIKLALCKVFGYKVTGVGFKKVHYTLSKAEALQWMGCYDEALLFKGKTLVGSRKAL